MNLSQGPSALGVRQQRGAAANASLPPAAPAAAVATTSAEAIAIEKRERLVSAKIDIHQVLLETLNLHLLDSVPREVLRKMGAAGFLGLAFSWGAIIGWTAYTDRFEWPALLRQVQQ